MCPRQRALLDREVLLRRVYVLVQMVLTLASDVFKATLLTVVSLKTLVHLVAHFLLLFAGYILLSTLQLQRLIRLLVIVP